jgi:quinol monooxygenase YgiN
LNTRDAFQKMVQELKTIVAKEGPLKVLTYESYFKGQGSEECLITETYANEEAFKTHLSLIDPL